MAVTDASCHSVTPPAFNHADSQASSIYLPLQLLLPQGRGQLQQLCSSHCAAARATATCSSCGGAAPGSAAPQEQPAPPAVAQPPAPQPHAVPQPPPAPPAVAPPPAPQPPAALHRSLPRPRSGCPRRRQLQQPGARTTVGSSASRCAAPSTKAAISKFMNGCDLRQNALASGSLTVGVMNECHHRFFAVRIGSTCG